MEIEVKSGIYIIRSEKLRIVSLGVSEDVRSRVRRFESDFRRGVKDRVISKMGAGLDNGVEFEVVEICQERGYSKKIKEVAGQYMERGYTVYGMMLESPREEMENVGVDLAVSERVERILGLGMSKRDLLEMLDKQIEFMVNKGAQEKFY